MSRCYACGETCDEQSQCSKCWRATDDEVERLKSVLGCRAGKLLLINKPFIIIANDETYYSQVYALIREHEKAKGSWTDECEQCFQEATGWDDDSQIPKPRPELLSVFMYARKQNELQSEVERLKELVEEMLIDKKEQTCQH